MDIDHHIIIYNIKEVIIRHQPSQKLTPHLLVESEILFLGIILYYYIRIQILISSIVLDLS